MLTRSTPWQCTDTDNVPQMKYNFVELANLESVEKDGHVDVIGIVKEAADVSQIITKATQKPVRSKSFYLGRSALIPCFGQLSKRELTLVDSSGMSVRLTLWGKQAENFSTGEVENPVIAFKGVRVGDFGGRSLSMMSGSSMLIAPDINEAHALRGWYDETGTSTSFSAYTSAGGGGGANAGASMQAKDFKLIGQAKDEMLGTNEEPDFFAVRAQLVYVKKESMSYPACGTCNKKVHYEEDSAWRCEKCEKNVEAPVYRYMGLESPL